MTIIMSICRSIVRNTGSARKKGRDITLSECIMNIAEKKTRTVLVEHEPRACAICGKMFRPASKCQKYCSKDCSKEALLADRRKYNSDYYFDEKRKQSEAYERERIHRTRVTPRLSLAEVNRRAREAHMTYGQYVLKYNI